MAPHFTINYASLTAAFALKVGLGYLWYDAWFGKAWARERGLTPGVKPMPSVARHQATQARVLRWLGVIVTVVVLSLATQVIRPSTWGAGSDWPSPVYGFIVATAAWGAFCMTPLLARVGWEGASWKLLRIHAAYHFCALQGACLILALWR